MKIKEEIGDKAGMTFAYNNIGVIYKNEGENEKALEYFNKSMDLCDQVEGGRGKASLYVNIGLVCKSNANSEYAYNNLDYAEDQYLKSVEYFLKALEINKSTGNKKQAANTYINLGIAHTERAGFCKDKEEAKGLLITGLEIQSKALAIQEEIEDKLGMTYSYKLIGVILRLQGDYEGAIRFLNKSVALAKAIGTDRELSKGYFQLSKTHELNKDYKLAFEYMKDYTALKDSLFNEDKSKEIGKLEAKYEFEKAEEEKKLVLQAKSKKEEGERNRRDNLQYSGILIFLVFLGGGLLTMGKLSLPVRVAEGLVFFSFLLFFEFLLVLLDPYIESYSGGEPAYKLLFNAVLAGMIFPLHALFENKIKARLS